MILSFRRRDLHMVLQRSPTSGKCSGSEDKTTEGWIHEVIRIVDWRSFGFSPSRQTYDRFNPTLTASREQGY